MQFLFFIQDLTEKNSARNFLFFSSSSLPYLLILFVVSVWVWVGGCKKFKKRRATDAQQQLADASHV